MALGVTFLALQSRYTLSRHVYQRSDLLALC